MIWNDLAIQILRTPTQPAQETPSREGRAHNRNHRRIRQDAPSEDTGQPVIGEYRGGKMNWISTNETELIGKTIIDIKEDKISEEYDDKPYLYLIMSDGTRYRIVSGYGGYTGNSEDEYPRFIDVQKEVV